MTCRDCTTAANILRRMGFRDAIGWAAFPGAPTDCIHASHSNSDGKSLCTLHRSELAWVAAGRPMRTTVYLAHPLSDGDFDANVADANCWLRFLRRMPARVLADMAGLPGAWFENHKPLILAPWLAAIEADGAYPGGRDAVIADCRDTVRMFDEVWLVGGRVTAGMRAEAEAARAFRDLTHLGTWRNLRYPRHQAAQ